MIVGFMNRRCDKIECNGAAVINQPDNRPAGQTKNRLIGGKIRDCDDPLTSCLPAGIWFNRPRLASCEPPPIDASRSVQCKMYDQLTWPDDGSV